MKLLKTFLILLLVVAVFGGAMAALNVYTGPIIAANKAKAESGPLAEVMPGSEGFDELDLTGLELPAGVNKVYKEKSGKGFVFEVTVDSGYQPGMVILCGVDADGKITGSKCTQSNETYGFESALNGQYNGKTLDDVDLIIAAGASPNSMTSKAYFAAIEIALQANVVVGGGELGPEIVLKNMIPTVVPAYNKLKEIEVTSDKVVLAFATVNESGFAYIMTEGESYYLAIVNTMGVCAIYNDAAVNVTAEHADLVAEAKALALTTKQSYAATLSTKIEALMTGASEITAIELNTFTTVVSVASFKVEDATYYAFFTKPLSYEDSAMEIVTILNADGAIVKQDIKQMAFGEGVEYMPGIKDFVNVTDSKFQSYLDRFTGITSGTLSDDVLVTGATVSSTAVKLATADVFAAFNSMNGGDQ